MTAAHIIKLTLLTFFAGGVLLLFAADPLVSVKVIAEDGFPVKDANVFVGWNLPRAVGEGWGAGQSVTLKDITTNADGIAEFRVADVPGIIVEKTGYYFCNTDDKISSFTSQFNNKIFALNQPHVEFTLLKKIHPVPMYVRRVKLQFAHPSQPMRFDFEAGDWVVPFGSGHHADLTVEAIRRGEKNNDFDLSVKLAFEGPGDGLILQRHVVRDRISEFRLVREAPIEGFQQITSWVDYIHASDERIAEFRKNKDYMKGSDDPRFQTQSFNDTPDDNYIFRIRSRPMDNEQVAKPLFGKIHGPIEIDVNTMKFLYYLNPSGSRSLEWDMEHNLAGNLIVPKEP